MTADSRGQPAMQDQFSASVQAAQRGLGAAADRVKLGSENLRGNKKRLVLTDPLLHTPCVTWPTSI